jgi:hypothetical protein
MIEVTVENDILIITIDDETSVIPMWLLRNAGDEEWQHPKTQTEDDPFNTKP